jgi:phosphoenolpyruvate synthase/pyruvate phosphate dikinase
MSELSKKIINKLDHETAEYVVRDMTFLTSSIFNETHKISFNKIFNFSGFSIFFWCQEKNGQVMCYRSGKEYDSMAEKIGKKYLKNIQAAKKDADKLIEMSDEINSFIRKNRKLENLIKKWNYFHKLYRDFFAYHQAVYWSSEYLTKMKNISADKNKIKKIVNILDKAYKYNETVFPNVERYFIELGISDLYFSEINEEVLKNIKTKPKKRSVLLIDGKRIILNFKEANEINKEIKKDYANFLKNKFLKNKKEIRGLAVSKGVARGRVSVIKNLNQLNKCVKDDILITTQTRPQFNTFIKLVKAIVTDEGGYLCHASMLAREFKMPCIVGTKIATKVLKDGDLVEVDANKGIVKIIKKT